MQKKRLNAQTGNGAQQPAQVVARSTTDGVQRIAQSTLQPTAIHAVIGLQVPNGGFYRCSPYQPLLLFDTQALEFASVNDLLVGVIAVHAAKAQINHDVFEFDVTGLLERRQGIDVDDVVRRVIWKDARHFRVSITVGDTHATDAGRGRLFKDYDTKVPGNVKRRRGE